MRYQEAEERPRLLDELRNAVQHYARITDEYKNKVQSLSYRQLEYACSFSAGLENQTGVFCIG